MLFLEGTWTIYRTIEPEGSLDGVASFARREDGCLDYLEQGYLSLGGERFAAERRYVFEPRPDGFVVWFHGAPRRLFHEVVLNPAADGALTGDATHPCGPDVYVSTYRFADGGFTIVHKVSGPRKNYTMTTIYARKAERQVAA